MKNTFPALVSASLLCSTFGVFAAEGEAKEKDPDDLMFSSFQVNYAETDFDNLGPGFNIGGAFGFRFPDFDVLAIELNVSATVIPGENDGGVSPPLIDNGNDSGDGGILDPILGGGDDDDGGSSSGCAGKNTRTNNEFQSNSFGIFASLETPRSLNPRFFGTARIGYSYVDATIPEMVEDGRGHTSWGLGVGYRYGESGRIELRFTQVSSDLIFIGLGYSY